MPFPPLIWYAHLCQHNTTDSQSTRFKQNHYLSVRMSLLFSNPERFTLQNVNFFFKTFSFYLMCFINKLYWIYQRSYLLPCNHTVSTISFKKYIWRHFLVLDYLILLADSSPWLCYLLPWQLAYSFPDQSTIFPYHSTTTYKLDSQVQLSAAVVWNGISVKFHLINCSVGEKSNVDYRDTKGWKNLSVWAFYTTHCWMVKHYCYSYWGTGVKSQLTCFKLFAKRQGSSTLTFSFNHSFLFHLNTICFIIWPCTNNYSIDPSFFTDLFLSFMPRFCVKLEQHSWNCTAYSSFFPHAEYF